MAPFKNISRGFIGSFISKVASTQSLAGVAATSTASSFTPGNGYVYHIFTSPGEFYVSNIGYCDCLVIGGGGGGSSSNSNSTKGGGGGAGGYNTETNSIFPAGTYVITIGAGGNGGACFLSPGSNGNPSYITGPVGFSSITAIGGGGGGFTPSPLYTNAGIPGGSGGGGGGAGLSISRGTGTLGQGNPGGNGFPSGGYSGGGGGGAGAAGGNAGTPTSAYGGPGGIGTVGFSGDTGIPTDYGTPGPTPGRWFAGGGGGGGSPTVGGGLGGAGGGGTGGWNPLNTPPVSGAPGTVNTGGGGGGTVPSLSGGNGGPGIVIIRYLKSH